MPGQQNIEITVVVSGQPEQVKINVPLSDWPKPIRLVARCFALILTGASGGTRRVHKDGMESG